MVKIYTKSQLTIMIIIGIVIFAMLIFLFYLVLFKTEKKLGRQSTESQQTAIGIASIKEFVNKCIEETAFKALDFIGKQGSFIYKSQGGFIPDTKELGNDHILYSGYKVSYGLKRPSSDISQLYFWQPPSYPWPEFPYTDTTYTTIDLNNGYYGQNSLPDLSGSNISILSQLEHFINNNASTCLNFQSFKTYNINYTNVTSSVIIGDNHIVANAKIPIIINKVTGEEITKIEDFSVPLKIRLKLIYNLARTIIDTDSNSLNFDASQVNFDVMEVSLSRNLFKKDDVLSITDPASTLYGRPFTFQFSIQNRYPALHYIIEQALPTLREGDEITFSANSPLVIIRDGSQIFQQNTNPKSSYDPDEDSLSYSYNPSLPYTISSQDTPPFNNNWLLTVKVSDELLEDYQDFVFETEGKPKK